jgi:hypothetical protein
MDFLSWTTSSVITPCHVTVQETRIIRQKSMNMLNRMFPCTKLPCNLHNNQWQGQITKDPTIWYVFYFYFKKRSSITMTAFYWFVQLQKDRSCMHRCLNKNTAAWLCYWLIDLCSGAPTVFITILVNNVFHSHELFS